MSKFQQAVLWSLVAATVIGIAGGARLYVQGQDNADQIKGLAMGANRTANRAAHAAGLNRQTLCAFAQLVADVADPTDTSTFGHDSRIFLAHVHDIDCPPNAVSFPKEVMPRNPGGNPGGRPGPPPGGSCDVEVKHRDRSLLCVRLP